MNEVIQPALDYAEKSGQTLEESRQLAMLVAEEGEKVASAVGPLVDSLVRIGLITAAEKQAAAEQLASHVGALGIVQNLLSIRDTEHRDFQQKLAAAGQGRSTPAAGVKTAGLTKDASADLADGGFVGRHRGAGEISNADRAMAQTLGIAIPE